jgi:tetratricopeptide (TPR) repeat protein
MQQPAQRPMPPQAPPQQPAAGGSNFTMNEVPDLTSKLSMLPSNSLQQFAQLHKGDPYIMALVMSESNRRKKLQQAGMQPQGEAPKVVDQMISSLALPEERGIAQLPTPNMANMADGGIAGYSDEEEGYAAGGVPGYADRGTVEEELPRGVFKMGDKLMYRDASGKMREYTAEAKKPGVLDMLKAVSDFSNRNAGKPPALPPVPGAPAATAPTFQTPNQQGFMPGGSTPPPMAPPPAPDNMAPQARPPAAAPAAAAAAPGITAIAPAPMTAADAMNAARQFTNVDAQNITSDLMAKKARVGQENEQNLADYQKGLGALPEAYKGYEERLKAQEAGAGKEKEDAQGMAIFKAGLAMMSGSSPNALQNIGKGALAGAEDYQGALKDLKKAAQERDKAFADIENARLAFKRDDMKTYQALKDRGQERLDRVDDKMIDFTSNVMGINSRDATQLYVQSVSELGQNQRSSNQIKSNERIAGNQLANQLAIAKQPGAQERLFAALDPTGKGNVGAGFKAYTDATSEGRGDQAILAAYAKDPNALAMLKDTDPMLYKSISERLRTQMIPPPPLVSGNPAAGQVRAP